MIVVLGNLRARVVAATAAERAWLRAYLSFPETRWTHRGEDARRTVVDDVSDTFPAGFAPLVRERARRDGVAYQQVDRRVRPCAPDLAADLSWLRYHPAAAGPIEYQAEAVEAVARHNRGIIHIPTGGGKTQVAVGVMTLLPCRWLVLVSARTLLRQMQRRWDERGGPPCGVVGDNERRPAWPVTVATFQSVRAAQRRRDAWALRLLAEAEGLVVDEAHELGGADLMGVAMSTPRAFFRLGLSATPLARGDGRGAVVVGALGPVIYRARYAALQAAGVLSRGTIVLHPCRQTTPVPWPESYERLVVRSKVRNGLVVSVAAAAPKPAMVFVRTVQHGRILERRLREAGIRVEFVRGEVEQPQRRAAIERLERGDTDVVVATKVFVTGVDVPSLATGVNAAGGASTVETVQRLGRTTRATADKSTFEFHDVMDDGDPDLRRHARARLRAYVAEGHDVRELPP